MRGSFAQQQTQYFHEMSIDLMSDLDNNIVNGELSPVNGWGVSTKPNKLYSNIEQMHSMQS